MTLTLTHFIVLSAILFGLGIYGIITRRNAIGILMSTELILNAVSINMVAVSRFLTPNEMYGSIFTIFIVTVAAAESVLGLAIVLILYKKKNSVNADEMDLMKW
jgi:NADH:ubiquinone oxidoreductase subunit K